MSWNYRVVLKQPEVEGDIEQYGFHEVYYDGQTPTACSVDAVCLHGDTPEELKDVVRWLARALRKPVLRYEDIKSP